LVPTPVYDTLGWEKVNYVIRFAEISVMFVVSTRVGALIANLEEDSGLTDIIVIEQEDQVFDFENVRDTRLRVHRFADALAWGTIFPNQPPRPETPAFLMFTSGTASYPKGCIVTHGNAIAMGASIVVWAFPFASTDSELVYLPLAHIFEAAMQVVALKIFGKVGFYSGSIPRLAEEFKFFRPTVITGVGRVYERLKQQIENTVAGKPFFVRSIFNAALNTKSFLTHRCHIRNVPLLDKAFEPVRRQFGGRLRAFVSGGSALSPDVQKFLRVACNVSFLQGYGLTETCGGALTQRWDDVGVDSCGMPLPWAEVKLRSTECYLAEQNTGELLVRGPALFGGYYKDEESTRAVFDRNGFFGTGDVFQLSPTGQLRMIARTKEIVKLSQGEYVSLPKLTALYSTADLVHQLFIHAGLHSRFLVAVAVAPPDRPDVTKEEVLAQFAGIARAHGLTGFEQIKDVFITKEEFTIANGLLTPTLKCSRFELERRFARELEALSQQ
jgi:long-chain acyl-CoA synthetase